MKEEAKPVEKTPAEKPDTKAKPDTAKPVQDEKKDTPKSDDEMDLGDEPETKPQSFEEVRDQIATEMAADAARVALDQAVTEVNKRMRSYFADRTIHETNVSVGVATEEEAPVGLDLKALAKEFGLEHGTTELVNRVSANETVPGSSYGLGSNFNQRGAPFAAMMFGAQTQDGLIPPQPEYSPLRTVDLEAAVTYMTWKTEDIEAYVPTLEECRDEVVLAIRMEQARELARADAEKIAQEASVEGKTLADVVPESKQANYLTGVGPFSWLDQVGFMQTSIGNVPELDAVGTEFMKKVFSTQVGEVAVAPNDRGSVFYVVTPTEFQPSIDQLHQQFRQPQQRFMAQLLGNDDAREIVRGFYESVDERTGFEMNLASDQ